METQQASMATPAAVIERAPSLLEQLEVRQAEVAQRYMPVMDIEQAIARHELLNRFISKILVKGVDYGEIPGTDKPVLLKPGAEKACAFFGYVPRYEVKDIEDWDGSRFGEPLFYYRYTCTLEKDGKAVGQGEGSANSWESKYRYRWVSEAQLPAGIDRSKLATRGGTVIEFAFAIDKAETSGQYGKPAEYWQRWRDAIERGEARKVTKTSSKGKALDAYEMGGTMYRVPNADFADIINTTQKMGQKRSYVAATLSATGLSQFFTQDMEDLTDTPEPTVRDIQRQAQQVDTGGAPVGTQQAANNVAERKLAEARSKQQPSPAPQQQANPDKLPTDFKAIMAKLAEMKGVVGEEHYYRELDAVMPGCKHANNLGSMTNFQTFYDRLLAIARSGGQEAA